MADKKLVNIIAPALRVLLRNDSTCPAIKFSTDKITDAADLSINAETGKTEIVETLKKFVKNNKSINAVNVDGLGGFKISKTDSMNGRAAGKVIIVTGAAQGFGLEISQDLANQGALVVLADINNTEAKKQADLINKNTGKTTAIAVSMNVTDINSIQSAIDQTVETFGGIDAFISNAGVLKAESVKTQPEKDFDFTTAVNYKGYYLCTQVVSQILETQHLADKTFTSDIIQINSKSGLEGSNKNFAYAGGKFGGIGLTQSFALELIEDGVKVNSICPGNFFDGPLWSDPDNGLFAQYLRTGKVPGAKTIADVKKFYEDKVPMKRGCTTADVMNAIYYVMDQQYETGQAIPVTGGQVMLH